MFNGSGSEYKLSTQNWITWAVYCPLRRSNATIINKSLVYQQESRSKKKKRRAEEEENVGEVGPGEAAQLRPRRERGVRVGPDPGRGEPLHPPPTGRPQQGLSLPGPALAYRGRDQGQPALSQPRSRFAGEDGLVVLDVRGWHYACDASEERQGTDLAFSYTGSGHARSLSSRP